MSFTSFTIQVNSRGAVATPKGMPEIGKFLFWFEISDTFEIEGELEHENKHL